MTPTTMQQKNCRFYCYKKTRKINPFKVNSNGNIELVLFDMDGVLTDIISSWKHVHDFFGTCNDESVDEYLKGKIDDLEFIKRDVLLWRENGKLVSRDRLVEILSDVPLMKGAKECVRSIKEKNVKTCIVSAGLDILAEQVAKNLGIDFVFANGTNIDEDGCVNGEAVLKVQLMYKEKTVVEISNQLGVPLNRIAAVGNSCFDIPMFEACGLGIAFNPSDDCVRDAADYVVEGNDLCKILPVLEEYIN